LAPVCFASPPSPLLCPNTIPSDDLNELRKAHILTYGQVKHGIGMGTLHLPDSHPHRKQLRVMEARLRVGRVALVFLNSRPLSGMPPESCTSSSHFLRSIGCSLSCVQAAHMLHGDARFRYGAPIDSCVCLRRSTFDPDPQASKERGVFVLAVHYIMYMWEYRLRLHNPLLSIIQPPEDDLLTMSRSQRLACFCLELMVRSEAHNWCSACVRAVPCVPS